METGLFGARANERLIRVDADDAPTGTATRAECHSVEGLRHRAFSVYLFDQLGRLLIQRRHPSKPLWPGMWSNSCCSHPIEGEATADAAVRRSKEELGLDVQLQQVHRYEYRATWRDVGTEHEVVNVFVGRFDPEALDPDPVEVADLRLFDPDALDLAIGESSIFTPWFQLAWPVVWDAWRERGDDSTGA